MNSRILEMGVFSRLWLVPGLGGGGLKMAFEHIAGEWVGWSSYRRARTCGDGRRAVSAGYGFRIEFAESVRGPVALGYGAHFGMGTFIGTEFRF